MSKSKLDLSVMETHSNSARLEIDRQQLATLPPAQRLAFYERTLLQHTPIHILPDGTFSKLESQLALTWQLTVPTHANDTLTAEAAEVFYSRNEFAVLVGTVPSFVAWKVGGYFRPSDLVTRLTVLYGPPQAPGGGNSALAPMLSMPRLRSVRIIFRDYDCKGFGPGKYLKPSVWAILELQKLTELTLQLIGVSRNMDEEGTLKDITSYLDAPTAADEADWLASQRIIEQHRGPEASYQGILQKYGWPLDYCFEKLCTRVYVRRWAEEQRLGMLAPQDVEMT